MKHSKKLIAQREEEKRKNFLEELAEACNWQGYSECGNYD